MARRRQRKYGLRGDSTYHGASLVGALGALRHAVSELKSASACSESAFDWASEGWVLVGVAEEHLVHFRTKKTDVVRVDLGDLKRDLSRLQYRKIKSCSVR